MLGSIDFPLKIRLSLATADAIGLVHAKRDDLNTVYLMTYTEGGCAANCAFCSQAKESGSDRERLSRIMWPQYPTIEILRALKMLKNTELKRICLQVINYPGFVEDTVSIVRALVSNSPLPISVDICPVPRGVFEKLKSAGVDRVGVPLDASTPELFDLIKGSGVGALYDWETHMEAIRDALQIFGGRKVLTNIIVGLGETEREAVEVIQHLHDLGVEVALFAFTPLRGTPMADRGQPPIDSYRRVQLARWLIAGNESRSDFMKFDDSDRLIALGSNRPLRDLIGGGEPFQTSGCPGCNRPYYNERPGRALYNYHRRVTQEELEAEINFMENAMG